MEDDLSAQLHHVSIFVRDMERSLELFVDLLGMRRVTHLKGVKGRRLSRLLGIADFAADMVFLKHPEQPVSLELVHQTGGEPQCPRSTGLNGFGLSLLVNDLEGLHRRLMEKGWAPISQPLEMVDPGGEPIKLFCFPTDEGLLVELIGKGG
jgi:catechol 2,3-dioxygenase-like lactoylglutathione lyase family enzyme